MTELIQKNHKVLLAIALELSERLRERSKYLVKPNITPRIFIGSSSEYLKVATKLEEALSKDRKLTVHLWKNGVFDLSQSNIESLVEEATHVDFAVFLLSKDDIVRSKGKKQKGPRDNVLFEYGLFMGMIGRDRTYALSCGGNVKITSFDGDRVMAVFTGNSKCSSSAKAGLQIVSAIRRVNEKLKEFYPSTSYKIDFGIGIDVSDIFVIKTGIRANNDLAWIGTAANNAAKLSEVRGMKERVFITQRVFDSLNKVSKFGGNPARCMWDTVDVGSIGLPVLGSQWWWNF